MEYHTPELTHRDLAPVEHDQRDDQDDEIVWFGAPEIMEEPPGLLDLIDLEQLDDHERPLQGEHEGEGGLPDLEFLDEVPWNRRPMPPGTHASENAEYRNLRSLVERQIVELALQAFHGDEGVRDLLDMVLAKDRLIERLSEQGTIDVDRVRAELMVVGEEFFTEVGPLLGVQGMIDQIPMDAPGHERTADAAFCMMGQLEWRTPENGQFGAAVLAGTLDDLPSGARMNCWESILFAAYRAGVVTLERLQLTYPEGVANDEQLQELLGVRRAEEVWSSGQDGALLPEVPKGALVFVHGSTGPMHHVVISLGGDSLNATQVMSLYHFGTGGVFGVQTLASYACEGRADALSACYDPFR